MNISLIGNKINNNKYLKFPKFNSDKKLRIILLIATTIFLIFNCFYGQAIAKFHPTCLEDMSHIFTQKINNFFLNNPKYNLIIKFIFSVTIDISIIYTLIVWSLFSSNIRLLSTGISYLLFNFLCRFIHIQIQPNNPSFYQHYCFSIFVNYHKTTYSFFPIVIGLIIICALEWKRNNNSFFWIFIFLSIGESIILICLQGNYFHEIFTSALIGHYMFMVNESVLRIILGEDYINGSYNNEKGDIEKYFDKHRYYNEDLLKKKAEEVKIELIKMNK
jgi:hypothetical protein